MGNLNRRVSLALVLLVAAACTGTPTVPLVTTATITGNVTTSAPTFAPLAGVTLTVLDGPAAGKSITTAGTGDFAFSTVNAVLTLRASKDGYESRTATVDAADPQTLRFTLKPVPAQVDETLTPDMGVACPDFAECRLFALPIHNDGKVSASIFWPAVSSPGLSLWRGETRIFTDNRGHTGSSYFYDVPVSGGAIYHLRVTYTGKAVPNWSHLSVLRPN